MKDLRSWFIIILMVIIGLCGFVLLIGEYEGSVLGLVIIKLGALLAFLLCYLLHKQL